MWQCQAILHERHYNLLSLFFFYVAQQTGQMYTSVGRSVFEYGGYYENIEIATIMRDSQTFEQCLHLGSGLAQTAIKRAPNDNTVAGVPVIKYLCRSDFLPTSVFHDPRLNGALLQFHKSKGRKSIRNVRSLLSSLNLFPLYSFFVNLVHRESLF